MSPDSVVLDVLRVRFPFGDPAINDELWREVDEQHFPSELRKRLHANGFRVGMLGTQVPVALSRLLELKDKPAPSGEAVEVDLAHWQGEPCVERQHMPLRAGRRGEIVACDIRDEMTLLLCDETGGLYGRSYKQAQAVFAVECAPQSDGRVRLRLVPELHFDEHQPRYVAQQGTLRLETGRPRREFPDMALDATLAPGDMLLISSLPNRPGSFGHQCLTANDGCLEQKLLIVRLAQTQDTGLDTLPKMLDLPE